MILNCFSLRIYTGIAVLVRPHTAVKTSVENTVVLAESVLVKETTAR